jgi:bacterioferritin-associated ferredoxin
VIICICRGKSERAIEKAIDNGAGSIRDLQRCGIGDQCGSCHNSLRNMLAAAAAAKAAVAAAPQPCPTCGIQPPASAGLGAF